MACPGPLSLTHDLSAAHRVISSHYDDIRLVAAELERRRYRRLGLVLGTDGALPMGALAKELRCDASNVTWLADRLEAAGWQVHRVAPFGDDWVPGIWARTVAELAVG